MATMNTCMTKDPAHCEAPREAEDDLTLVHSVAAFIDKTVRRYGSKLLRIAQCAAHTVVTNQRSRFMSQFMSVDADTSLDTKSVLASAGASQRSAVQHNRSRLNVGRCESLATLIASLLSHDIRHHLSAVYCNAEFMSEPAALATDRKQLFEEVKLAIEDVTKTLDFILLHARSEPPSQDVVESFNDLIERTLAAIRPHPHAAGVSITTGESPSISALFNKTIVASAVYNLLLNACFAAQRASEPGKVEISLQEDHSCVCIRVKDNGSGVPVGVRQNLSQPFVTLGKQGGMGLGITIADYVAREYGGTLQLESSCPGSTIFVLRLSKSALQVLEHALVRPSGRKSINRRSYNFNPSQS
jgi:C4-dicarboxylate-specific signal transduction histidine kinase